MEQIVCPSGLTGNVRGMKGGEIKLFTGKGRSKAMKTYNEILSRCWETTLDPGIYGFKDNPPWEKILTGDRFKVYMWIRGLTFGWDFDFNLKCNGPGCGEAFEWSVDLREIPVQELSEESKKIIAKGGGRFTCKDPRGKKVEFRLPIGRDEKTSFRLNRDPDGDVVLGTLHERIYSIEGVEKHHKIIEYLEDLEFEEVMDLIDAMQEWDCGVETEIEVECPYCGWPMDVEIPFERGFMEPSMKKKREKKKKREERRRKARKAKKGKN